MNVKTIVIDASAALKWRLRDEEATDQADELLDDFLADKLHLLVPTLFDYEITNALKVAVTLSRLSEDEALSAIADFQAYRIEQIAFSRFQEQAFRLACRYKRSVYDSAYLALAQHKGIYFYTGDKRLFNALGKTLTWIKWIGDYTFEAIPNNE